MTPEEQYLDLLQRSLCDDLYLENEARIVYLLMAIIQGAKISRDEVRNIERDDHPILQTLRQCREEGRVQFKWRLPKPHGKGWRIVDLRDCIEVAHTMIGRKRLGNIVDCLDVIRRESIPGDWIETGVWRGGAVVLMQGYSAIYGMDRTVWAADSFQGLPKPSKPQDEGYDFSSDVVPVLAISEEEVRNLFRKYNLYDPDKVRFLKGWFKDTLPTAPINELSLLRLDGDLYESTMDALIALYDRVVSGGFVIVDDYGDFEPCRKAVDEFRSARNISDPVTRVDWTGVYWRKS
jgi:hypothetical protein